MLKCSFSRSPARFWNFGMLPPHENLLKTSTSTPRNSEKNRRVWINLHVSQTKIILDQGARRGKKRKSCCFDMSPGARLLNERNKIVYKTLITSASADWFRCIRDHKSTNWMNCRVEIVNQFIKTGQSGPSHCRWMQHWPRRSRFTLFQNAKWDRIQLKSLGTSHLTFGYILPDAKILLECFQHAGF